MATACRGRCSRWRGTKAAIGGEAVVNPDTFGVSDGLRSQVYGRYAPDRSLRTSAAATGSQRLQNMFCGR